MRLIILLIVLRILSSLFHRNGGKQPSPSRGPARLGPARPPLPPDIFDIRPLPEVQADPEEEKETESVRRIVPDPPGQPLFYRDEISGEQDRSFVPAPASYRRGAVSPGAGRQQKTARHRQKSELARLLKGDSLALGLIALEVLSPPRARRSFYSARAGK